MDPMQNLEDSDRRMGEPTTMSSYEPQRSRWPGIIGAVVVMAAVAGVALWSHHEKQAAPPTTSGAVAPAQPQAQAPRADAQQPQQADAVAEAASAAPVKQ